MSDSPMFPATLPPVHGCTDDETGRARRAVLLRTDLPVTDPRRLDPATTLDVLAMLGLVTVPPPPLSKRKRSGGVA